MGKANRAAIDWAIALLEIQPNERVLEVGFGPGVGIQRAAMLAHQGRVAGVELSWVMLAQARRRCAPYIAAGQVELLLGDSASLPYPEGSFHKALAVNVLYFWEEPLAHLGELRRVLAEGGRLALYVAHPQDMGKLGFTRTRLYRLYAAEEAAGLLSQAGFSQVRVEQARVGVVRGICLLATK